MRSTVPAHILILTLAGAIPAIAETAITIHAGRLLDGRGGARRAAS